MACVCGHAQEEHEDEHYQCLALYCECLQYERDKSDQFDALSFVASELENSKKNTFLGVDIAAALPVPVSIQTEDLTAHSRLDKISLCGNDFNGNIRFELNLNRIPRDVEGGIDAEVQRRFDILTRVAQAWPEELFDVEYLESLGISICVLPTIKPSGFDFENAVLTLPFKNVITSPLPAATEDAFVKMRAAIDHSMVTLRNMPMPNGFQKAVSEMIGTPSRVFEDLTTEEKEMVARGDACISKNYVGRVRHVWPDQFANSPDSAKGASDGERA